MRGYIHPSLSPEAINSDKDSFRWYETKKKKPAGGKSNTKLDPDKVRWIRQNEEGLTQRAMAKRLGVSEQAVREAYHYVTWQDVE